MLTLAEKKERLLTLILQDGILFRTPTQPILSRDGTFGRWMLNSLAVSLTHEGIQLAAACLLDLLSKFEGRQIATYGTTAIPLVTACVLQGGGRYEALLVRKERKPHGSLKLIEGRINRDEPVIIIDDSVSSGISMQKCRDTLEADGFRVEGGICLVRFGWYGGFGLMQEQGYHMETVFDIDHDVSPRMDSEPKVLQNPTKYYLEHQLPWHSNKAPEGLSPTVLARTVLTEYLSTGQLLQAPEQLDQTYVHQGGCFISLRQKDQIHLRHARDGFWHFPGERCFSPSQDIVHACWQTARRLPRGEQGLKLLAESAIAVTFFSKLEACTVGELDNDRYGIVVRSQERPTKMGGALPRMPGLATAGQQFNHAFYKNAQLVSFEPYTLYRHDVFKYVEEEVKWQPTGVALDPNKIQWFESVAIARLITQRARTLIKAQITQTIPTDTTELPADLCLSLDALYISVLFKGQLQGCMGKSIKNLDQDVQILAEAVLADQRFAKQLNAENVDQFVIKIYLLHAPLELGAYSPEEVMNPVRFCEQALMVHQGDKTGILLPDVPVLFNYDEKAYVAEVLDKAGITRPPYAWLRYDCSSWLDDGHQVYRMQKAFPRTELKQIESQQVPALAGLWASYIQRQRLEDGSFYFYYFPFSNKLQQVQDKVRTAHTLWVLTRAQQAQLSTIEDAQLIACLNFLKSGLRKTPEKLWLSEASSSEEVKNDTVAGSALLLMALSAQQSLSLEDNQLAQNLAQVLWQAIDPHGRVLCFIHATDSRAVNDEPYQDYIGGQVLMALALAAKAGITPIERTKWMKALSYYQHRSQYKRRADLVSWMVQGLGACWQLEPKRELAVNIFALVDWVLEYQSQLDGGFTTRQQQGRADYMTAVYLEAVAVALNIARQTKDQLRTERYQQACELGFAFLDKQTVQARDASVLPNLAWAEGGLRQSTTNSTLRIDFTQHALSAALYTLGK
ncbi:AMMECR1 domain-containing protein [uncultured Thiothrix sp.]|uniref:AMMECR1 domain-containing protein n=1 Tax=uncultured Thiothrix sp. TaxID=223185 RepID=UPI00262CB034|nr:AMMECR1 domain-containing protein [uncultured Thiothrix sp.]